MERLQRLKLSTGALRLVRAARVAHLATVGVQRWPLVLPICFAFDGGEFFSAIDEKPKRVSPRKLKRLQNIEANSRVSLVIDRYGEDWRNLAYVLVSGQARILLSGRKHRRAVSLLRKKYRQYRSMAIHQRPVIVIRPLDVKVWGHL